MDRVSEISILRVLWARFTLRHWRAAPGQSMLLLLILALGIAVFFSIRLANRAAVSSFQNFTDLLSRESDWLIQAPAGALPEGVLLELREKLGAQPVHLIPVIETTATRPRETTEQSIATRTTFQILGIDLFAMGNLPMERPRDRSWFNQGTDPVESGGPQVRIWNTLRSDRAVFISDTLARTARLAIGSTWPLVINEQIVSLEVAGIIPADPGSPQIPETLLIMDLPAVQRLSGKVGKLDRIGFVVEPGARATALRGELRHKVEEWGREFEKPNLRVEPLAEARTAMSAAQIDLIPAAKAVRAPGGERWRVSTPADRRESAAAMTRAFRVNLTILSLLALVVGLYLIVQALDGAVVRRREEIGILRSLGVEEGTIRRAWMGEAALLGLGGGVIGILLGWIGAQLAVRMVGRTVNALYYATSVNSARLEPAEVIIALTLAVATSLVAGWVPARAAALTPPAQILVRHAVGASGSAVWRNEWLGFVLLMIGLPLIFVPPLRFEGGGRFSLAGYLAALCWILGAGILGGLILRRLAVLGRLLNSRFAIVHLAMSHLVKPSGRHRLAVAGLVCAIAMTCGMAILVGSFETTMRGWIERTFQADLYLSSDGAQSASTQNRISLATWREIAGRSDVADANAIHVAEI
ncbi:MAG: FtsX-like permease family protein, partial [Opitutaceae bacterium]|nr:FtsX-like permease family protein [Verrucomicrobiales bacterium]